MEKFYLALHNRRVNICSTIYLSTLFIFVFSLILTRIQISVSQRPDEEYSDLMLDMVRDIFYILFTLKK